MKDTLLNISKPSNDITITELSGKRRLAAHTILYDSWYSERKSDAQEEKIRIVEAVAKIIRSDIRA